MLHDVPQSNQELFLKGVILIYIFLTLRINLIKNAINIYSLYFCVEYDKKIKTGKKIDVVATFKEGIIWSGVIIILHRFYAVV